MSICGQKVERRKNDFIFSNYLAGPPSKSTYWVPEDLMNQNAPFIRICALTIIWLEMTIIAGGFAAVEMSNQEC